MKFILVIFVCSFGKVGYNLCNKKIVYFHKTPLKMTLRPKL